MQLNHKCHRWLLTKESNDSNFSSLAYEALNKNICFPKTLIPVQKCSHHTPIAACLHERGSWVG